MLRVQGGGSIRFGVRLNGVDYFLTTPTGSVTANTWNYVTATYDGSQLKVYINGALSGTPVSATGTMTDNGVNLRVGRRQDTASPFSGMIDEVRVYNRSLSASEITSLYNFDPLNVPSPTPVPSASSTPKPGDIDGNNKVDIFDYNIVLTDFAKTGSGVQGDVDGNNKVDIFDYNIVLTNFGK